MRKQTVSWRITYFEQSKGDIIDYRQLSLYWVLNNYPNLDQCDQIKYILNFCHTVFTHKQWITQQPEHHCCNKISEIVLAWTGYLTSTSIMKSQWLSVLNVAFQRKVETQRKKMSVFYEGQPQRAFLLPEPVLRVLPTSSNI